MQGLGAGMAGLDAGASMSGNKSGDATFTFGFAPTPVLPMTLVTNGFWAFAMATGGGGRVGTTYGYDNGPEGTVYFINKMWLRAGQIITLPNFSGLVVDGVLKAWDGNSTYKTITTPDGKVFNTYGGSGQNSSGSGIWGAPPSSAIVYLGK